MGFAKWAAEQAPKSEIWAFEPMPPLVECLRRNVRPQDKVFPIGISNKPGEMTLDYLPHYTLLSGIGAGDLVDQYKKAERARKELKDETIEDAFQKQQFTVKIAPLSETLKPLVDAKRKISMMKVDC